jgi:predicted ATPase
VTQKIIVITGAPSSGKTTLIEALKTKGYTCFDEISRAITLEAQEKGIDQLFLHQPLLFSDLLMEGRKKQLIDAEELTSEFVFLDRGIPDILAYMDYINESYLDNYIQSCENYRYTNVFLLPPWKDIYITDAARYETYEEAMKIHENLLKTYQKHQYNVVVIPTGTVEERIDFIFNHL